MSAHELEPPKEEKPGFTGRVGPRVQKGTVLYWYGPSKPFEKRSENTRLTYFLVLGEDEEQFSAKRKDDVVMSQFPIGHGNGRPEHTWWVPPHCLAAEWGERPAVEYLVVSGLGLPDELMFEVYLYCRP